MTLAELERAILSKKRVERAKAQERASFDYILADLIGKSVSRIYSSSNNIPEIAEAYPSLFDSAEVQEQKRMKREELTAMRFRQFANSFNARFNKEEAENE